MQGGSELRAAFKERVMPEPQVNRSTEGVDFEFVVDGFDPIGQRQRVEKLDYRQGIAARDDADQVQRGGGMVSRSMTPVD